MEKSATLNLRINPTLKQDAESVLSRLGIPMSTAVDMFLNQVVLSEGIPFAVTLPKVPEEIDTTKMSSEQIHTLAPFLTSLFFLISNPLPVIHKNRQRKKQRNLHQCQHKHDIRIPERRTANMQKIEVHHPV